MQRADDAIEQDVVEVLAAEGNLETSTIGVAVKNGIVYLEGTVPTEADRRSAERISRRVAGVSGVIDDLVALGARKTS